MTGGPRHPGFRADAAHVSLPVAPIPKPPAPWPQAFSPPASTSSCFLKFMDPIHVLQGPVMGSSEQDLKPWGQRRRMLNPHLGGRDQGRCSAGHLPR